MDQKHKDLLQRNHTRLKRLLKTNIDELCTHFYPKIFMIDEKDEILDQHTNLDKADKFLENVRRGGPLAFDWLYTFCVENDLFEAADILKPDKGPHGESLSKDPVDNKEIFEKQKMLEDPWPTQEYFELVTSEKFPLKNVEDKILYDKHINNEEFFQMTRRKLGNVLLLYDATKAYDCDRKGLAKLFQNLNFLPLKSLIIPNKTDLDKCKFLTSETRQECDCIVVFILASGTESFLNTKGAIDAILDKLKNRSDLKEKPKLIFHINLNSVQTPSHEKAEPTEKEAGPTEEEAGPTEEEAGPTEEEAANQSQDRGEPLVKNHNPSLIPSKETTKGIGRDGVDGPSLTEKIPKNCDFYFIRSTDYGSESFEEFPSKKCTRFIQLIVKVFSECAKFAEFYDLIRLVNQKAGADNCVAEVFGETVSKKLYFFPGCVDGHST